jgi:hypothetical protein
MRPTRDGPSSEPTHCTSGELFPQKSWSIEGKPESSSRIGVVSAVGSLPSRVRQSNHPLDETDVLLSSAGNLPAVDKMVGPAPSFDVGYAGLVFDIAQHRATRKGLVQ